MTMTDSKIPEPYPSGKSTHICPFTVRCGKMCYKEGLAFRCDNFLWRGAAEGGGTK